MMTPRSSRPPQALTPRTALVHALIGLGLGLGLPHGAMAQAPADVPVYGGTLSIANVSYTVSPISFDPADFVWKIGQDVGLVYEQLFAADLSQATSRGGKFPFRVDAWLPNEALRGELAERWELKQNPWRAEIQIRKGVMFPEKPGVMAARELTADDIVYSFERQNKSPKKVPGYYDHVAKAEATGRYTVTFTFKEYNAEWNYRFGYGYYSPVIPKEVVAAGAGNWRNVNGTGPFVLADYVPSNTLTFAKNPKYWDKEMVGGKAYALPYVDKIAYRVIKDESTMLAALRTGKLDIAEAVRWTAVEELKRSAPKLQFAKGLQPGGTYLALRMDTKPFDDLRVRRALNMAINKEEIIRRYYGGNAEMLGFPQLRDYAGYYEPLEAMPESIRELFTYNPGKAKQLLADAGYPNGFSFKVHTSAINPDNDLLQLLAGYLAKVGVKLEIQSLEYAVYLNVMNNKTNAPGYFAYTGATTPTTSLRKSFVSTQRWNPAQHADPAFDKKVDDLMLEPDERVRQIKVRLLTREVLDKAPFIWLPSQYTYTAWWPWVRNYGGELRAGAERPGPIHTRIWIDQALKQKMGF